MVGSSQCDAEGRDGSAVTRDHHPKNSLAFSGMKFLVRAGAISHREP
jgi:hypothetical protein